ncbi:MAG TPA: right-handed parallel beta-helix repeat-containing protein [Pyrinomonadaceae bacterium]|nr:right-handed parallel beta-helix repeat-containing protein [Pyrinomonadaceae bacterium]
MNKTRFTFTALAIVAFTLMISSSAQAQATRTWVSGVGDDVNPCSRTAPCKTFAGAISKTAKDGEIDALDPGGFGGVTIVKSITISGGPTGEAGISNSLTTGIIVNITDAADVRKTVVLRSIAINGMGSGLRGIRIVAGSRVFVENCFISGNHGNPGHGIEDVRTSGSLNVDNTNILNNLGNAITVTGASVNVSNSRLAGNGNTGLVLGNNAKGTIMNSVVTNNVGGFFLSAVAGTTSELNVDHCIVSNNNTGFIANTAGTTIRVSNTNAANNGTLATVAGGGAVSSYGNNQTGGLAFPSAGTGQN